MKRIFSLGVPLEGTLALTIFCQQKTSWDVAIRSHISLAFVAGADPSIKASSLRTSSTAKLSCTAVAIVSIVV